MFRIKFGQIGRTFDVRFHYHLLNLSRDKHGTFSLLSPPANRQPVGLNKFDCANTNSTDTIETICRISSVEKGEKEKNEYEVIVEDSMICDTRDSFDKSYGRWETFKKVMRQFKLYLRKDQCFSQEQSKRICRRFWLEYCLHHKDKKHLCDRIPIGAS